MHLNHVDDVKREKIKPNASASDHDIEKRLSEERSSRLVKSDVGIRKEKKRRNKSYIFYIML